MPALVAVPWLLLALLALGLAVVGIVVPGLPTTPFLLLSAWAAARGSPRLHAWLLRHRRLGPVISAWERERAIPRGAKIASAVAMAACTVLLLLTVRPLLGPILATVAMALVSWWICTRPDGAPRE